jgi:hypothetical protein
MLRGVAESGSELYVGAHQTENTGIVLVRKEAKKKLKIKLSIIIH